MKDTDMAYIAGLFDVLGCIRIEVPKKSEKASLYTWITSKNFKMMEYLQQIDAMVGKRNDGQFRAKWRDTSAASFLSKILPHLKYKVDQAKVGIEFIDARKNDSTIPDDVFIKRLKLCYKSQD
jgi:hypothetical protein